MAGVPVWAPAAGVVAHWHLNEDGPPFADAGAQAVALTGDIGTTPALALPGIEGSAALLHVDSPPTATRLYADPAALPKDSFGFSFWIRPVSINPFDNLLAKEMAFNHGIPNDERMAWQVHILNGFGTAAVEFVVRGDDRTAGQFYGAVSSAAVVPLSGLATQWIHIAGGYDAHTGELRLFVDGSESVAEGTPGATCSDGSPLAVGTAKNGSDIVAYAASTLFEDLQLYDSPLYAEEVDYLMENPGQALPGDFFVSSQSISTADGDVTVQFEATSGANYRVEAGTELDGFITVASFENSVNLVHDSNTTGPWTVIGREGSSLLLRFEDPGPGTRLYANSPVLQTDSFGFSFWVRPSNINAWDNLIAKEIAYNGSVESWSRLAWQVHLLDGTSSAPLELVVRGDHRAVTNFYGAVQSSTALPLHTDSPDWVHIAGGYDATTGGLSLYVNGVGNTSAGIPGAHNSDGSPLALGTVRNGGDAVQFAAVARIDDLQLYERPLSATQVAHLMAWPGQTVAHTPRLAGRWRLNEPATPYWDSAQARSAGAIDVSATTLQSELGPSAAARAFFRVLEFPQPTGFHACE